MSTRACSAQQMFIEKCCRNRKATSHCCLPRFRLPLSRPDARLKKCHPAAVACCSSPSNQHFFTISPCAVNLGLGPVVPRLEELIHGSDDARTIKRVVRAHEHVRTFWMGRLSGCFHGPPQAENRYAKS